MKLDIKRTFLIGFAFFSISFFWMVYEGEIPKILVNTFGLSETLKGLIMALDNILAIFMLPLFGWLSDHTKSKFGRRMPYVIIGSIVAAIVVLLVPLFDSLEQTFGTQQSFFIPFVFVLGLLLFIMGVYRSPAVALMPDITPKPLRSKANAVINLMGAVGGLLALVLISLLVKEGQSRFPIFISVSLFLIGSVAILLWKVDEPALVEKMKQESATLESDEEEKEAIKEGKEIPLGKDKVKSLLLILFSIFFWFMGYNAVSTSFSVYAGAVLGMTGGSYSIPLLIAQASSIIAFYPIAIVGTKLGRRRTILIGIALLASAFAAISFINASHPVYFIYILFTIAGIGWSSITINSYPMVVELSQGNNVGKFTGYYYTFSMLAQIITPIFSGFLIDGLANGDERAYYILFPYGALFVGLSAVTMYFVKHGDSKPVAPKDKLEVFAGNDD